MQHKLLIIIVSPNIHISLGISQKKVNCVWSLKQNLGQGPMLLKKKTHKETGISMGFFHILHEV